MELVTVRELYKGREPVSYTHLVENQIQQVDDLLSNPDNLAGIVILPYDNGLQSTIEKIATADVPFVQFDRVIESDIINEKVVANVKGDNEGIGYETAKRFIADGLTKDDYVYEMIGDNSSVPELRSKGFRKYLTEQGWTDEEKMCIRDRDYR